MANEGVSIRVLVDIAAARAAVTTFKDALDQVKQSALALGVPLTSLQIKDLGKSIASVNEMQRSLDNIARSANAASAATERVFNLDRQRSVSSFRPSIPPSGAGLGNMLSDIQKAKQELASVPMKIQVEVGGAPITGQTPFGGGTTASGLQLPPTGGAFKSGSTPGAVVVLERVKAAADRVRESARAAQQELLATVNKPGPGMWQGRFNQPIAQFAVGGDKDYAKQQADRINQIRAEKRERALADAEASKGQDTVAQKQQRAIGLTYVGTQVLRSMGIEGSRAIEVIANQFLNMGVTLEDLLTNKLVKFTVALAAVAVAVEATKALAGAFEETALALAHVEERKNFVDAFTGRTGTLSKQEADVRALVEAQESIEFFGSDSRRAAEIRARALGGRGSEQEVAAAQLELDRLLANRRTTAENLEDTFNPFARSRRIALAKDKLAVVSGTDVGDAFLNQTALRAGQQLAENERRLRGTGKKNIFDDADESVRKFADSMDKELQTLINTTKDREFAKNLAAAFNPQGDAEKFLKSIQDTTLTKDQVEKAKLRFDLEQKQKKEQLDSIKEVEDALRESFERENRRLDLFADARKGLDALKAQLSDNPIEQTFLKGKAALEELDKRFKDLPPSMLRGLKEVQAQLVGLELFKEAFSADKGFRQLRLEIAKLDSGAFPNQQRLEREQQERVNIARRREGLAQFVDPMQELEAQIKDARFAGQYVRAAELENQQQNLELKARQERVQAEFREAELRAERKALATATPDRAVFILDQILSQTSDVASLSSEERDLRLKALQQRLKLGEGERQRVLIQIQQDAALSGVVRTSIDEQGSEPDSSAPSPSSSSQAPSPFDPLSGSY